MKPRFLAALALAGLAFAPAAWTPGALAENKQRISGPGSTLTNAKCTLCHDNDHISRTRLTRPEWEENLRNMQQRGMPPLSADEAATILTYLSTYYAPGEPPAATADTLVASTADPVRKLLDANACLGCHAVDQKLVGPGFREVAAKYAGDNGAAARLAAKIRSGGKGSWGEIPMPGNSVLTDAELASIAGWVLAQK